MHIYAFILIVVRLVDIKYEYLDTWTLRDKLLVNQWRCD